MRYEEFVDRVRQRVHIGSEEGLVKAVTATLETFGERVPPRERRHVAAQLPRELKEPLLKREHDVHSLEEFYDRVAERSGSRRAHAVVQARAVLVAIREAISAGEIEDVLGELPEEFGEVFGEEPRTPASPTALTTEELSSTLRDFRARNEHRWIGRPVDTVFLRCRSPDTTCGKS